MKRLNKFTYIFHVPFNFSYLNRGVDLTPTLNHLKKYISFNI